VVKAHLEKGNYFESDMVFYFLHELLADNTITISHCGTHSMIADVLTKPLGGSKFQSQRKALLNFI